MSKWQDIETAPEDEWILFGLALPSITEQGVVINGKCYNPDQDYKEIIGVTHWMPLPEPPKEKDG